MRHYFMTTRNKTIPRIMAELEEYETEFFANKKDAIKSASKSIRPEELVVVEVTAQIVGGNK